MSQKKMKAERKRNKKFVKGVIKRALEDLQQYPFWERVRFCFWIMWGKKNGNKS